MDPTNLLLIVALGATDCQTRSQAQFHLEKQGVSAMVTLLTFEKDPNIEVARSCKVIKERITSRYILDWAEGAQFYAMGYNKLDEIDCYNNEFFQAAEKVNRDEYTTNHNNVGRHATRLWAIDRLLKGESWSKIIEELVGDDGLTDSDYYMGSQN